MYVIIVRIPNPFIAVEKALYKTFLLIPEKDS